MTHTLSSFEFLRRIFDCSIRIRHAILLGIGFVLVPFLIAVLLSGEVSATAREFIEQKFSNTITVQETDVTQPIGKSARSLAPNLAVVVDAIARRYRVAQPAVEDIVILAESAAKSTKLDPLLILAVIGVESRFNPYAASPFGAQGLMQVIGKFHTDKYQPTPDGLALLDPETNINVGTRILREYLNNTGDLNAALKRYGGETDDSGFGYAEKVHAEKERLQQLTQRSKKT